MLLRVKITKGDCVKLSENQMIEFGAKKAYVRVVYRHFKFLTSALTKKEKLLLKDVLKGIPYASLVESTQEATHIVANKVKLTSKVLVGLSLGYPIISIEYVVALRNRASIYDPLPDPEAYAPTIISDECTQDMMKINLDRKKLFMDKTFVIALQYQIDLFRELILASSGKVIDITKSESKFKEVLEAHRYDVWIYPSSEPGDASEKRRVETLLNELKAQSITPVLDSEIAKAVLTLDLEQFCNPPSPPEPEHSDDFMFNKDDVMPERVEKNSSPQSSLEQPSSSHEPVVDFFDAIIPSNSLEEVQPSIIEHHESNRKRTMDIEPEEPNYKVFKKQKLYQWVTPVV